MKHETQSDAHLPARVQTLADVPSLPQHDNGPGQQDKRRFQLSIARTAYNYVRSYPHLESVPLAADVPSADAFSLDYSALVIETIAKIAENFLGAGRGLIERQLVDDTARADIAKLANDVARLKKLDWKHPITDITAIVKLTHDVLVHLPSIFSKLSSLPFDARKYLYGFEAAVAESLQKGPTAFLDSTLFDMLGMVRLGERDPLQALSTQDYEKLFVTLPVPLMLSLPRKPWMTSSDRPCEQDWFFGYLQVAGFNTTNLRGVVAEAQAGSKALTLSELRAKMGKKGDPTFLDRVLQNELADPKATLESAVKAGNLYACDYATLATVDGSKVHGKPRYIAAPIALFYWNAKPPAGYPGHGDRNAGGVLQPIAIQLAQEFDAKLAPVFTPKDSAHANDQLGFKWKIAKLFVNESASIQHESVAHLGDCHLIIESVVLATHRQLADVHPLFKLLLPHFRFTLPINDGAIHNLVIPGGVVATNVAPAMASTLGLIDRARQAWGWDENSPDRIFKLRGVSAETLAFPFRDDTLLLWGAIRRYVRSYLNVYYRSDADLLADNELQGWVQELVDPRYAALQGMDGLKLDNGKARIDNLDYLTDLVAQVIYIAGPQHASVNYPQYPLGSFAPSVAASVYSAPPGQAQTLSSEQDCLPWFLPLDVALYTVSFEYLLSGVQYDKLGHYDSNPRTPYFTDPAVHDALATFQAELARIEVEIRERNHRRPMDYPFQLPSQVPNSISI